MGTHPIFESDFDCLTECLSHVFTSTCPLVALQPVVSSWSSVRTSSHAPPRTSAPCALEKKVSATLDPPSTVSFHNSCARVVTSPITTVLVANRSTERTSRSSTLAQASSPWPTPDQTPTVRNSSSAPLRLHGLTANTLFSAALSKVWMSSRRLKV